MRDFYVKCQFCSEMELLTQKKLNITEKKHTLAETYEYETKKQNEFIKNGHICPSCGKSYIPQCLQTNMPVHYHDRGVK